ncbi:TonB-dependent receptor domain-containing protein [Allosphingosinicella deserti]|nr:TonB-dependent receptor [Sphingomonas deserti]
MSPYIRACLSGLAATLSASSAAAQSEDPVRDPPQGSATRAAEDAFGATVGINQVGLYSPYQTRGFDLISTGGAFRIDGFYFHPAALPSDALVSGSSINVGIAATALDLSSPTGVVGYRLREPGARTSLTLTAGTRGFGSPSLETIADVVSGDGRWDLTAYGFASPEEKWATGQEGSRYDVGAVARWMPGPATRLRLFAGISGDTHDGDLAVLPQDAANPPPLRVRRHYAPDWARTRATTTNLGALFEHRWGDWTIGASAIRSTRNSPRTDTTVLEIDGAGLATSTVYHTDSADIRSDSAEAKAFRSLGLLGARHRIGVAVRQRNSVSRRADAVAFPAGRFDIAGVPVAVPSPDFPDDVPSTRDQVNQRILSATYELSAGDAFELRLGIHRNRYEKKVRNALGAQSAQLDKSWLYSASALWNPTSKLHLFASYVSGLEESGLAPDAALNRGEVLPPVEARQYEVGVRYDLTPRLGLILAGFDIRKPIYGLRADSIYAPVGTVRHRGVEASLTGQLTPTTTLVLGANLVRPRISGEQVDAGIVNPVAPGVSRFNGTIAVEQKITDRWSVDGYLLYEGKRRRDSLGATEVAGVPFAILGTRYDWTAGKAALSLRVQLVNALDRKGYYATPYGPLVPISGQHMRILLTTRL